MVPGPASQEKIQAKILVCNWMQMRYLQDFHISTGSVRNRETGGFRPVDFLL